MNVLYQKCRIQHLLHIQRPFYFMLIFNNSAGAGKTGKKVKNGR